MKNAKTILLAAGLLAIPASGSAQGLTHFSLGIGLAARSHPGHWPGPGIGLAHRPQPGGVLLVFGGSARGSLFASGHSGCRDCYGYGHHDGWGPYGCWDYLRYDPWFGCDRFYPLGYGSFGWWNPYPAWWWQLGFLGWPSPRYIRYHWFAHASFWYGGWDWWYPRFHGARYRYPHRYVYRGYGTGGRAKARGDSGGRIVRGSPLFGPRYKEDPRRHVAGNARERPVSRAVPRGSRVDDGGRRGGSRPGDTPNTRRPRPRGEAAPVPTRATPPKLTTRTGSPPRARATPTRTPRPKARPTTPRRSATTVRTTPARGGTPRVRPSTSTRSGPTARSAPSRTSRAKPATPGRSTPKARPAPSRRSPPKASRPKPSAPKARPAPSRRSPPKASRPKPSAPKARPAPSRRSPPKASAPKRSAAKARPAPRRSGSSKKPPPRRSGKD